jgi:hypothetical protein
MANHPFGYYSKNSVADVEKVSGKPIVVGEKSKPANEHLKLEDSEEAIPESQL